MLQINSTAASAQENLFVVANETEYHDYKNSELKYGHRCEYRSHCDHNYSLYFEQLEYENFNKLNINKFPPEVLQIIFKYYMQQSSWMELFKLRVVCRHWRTNIEHYCKSVCKIKLEGSGCVKFRPHEVVNFVKLDICLKYFTNVKELYVMDYIGSDLVITIIRQRLESLSMLSLRGCINMTYKGYFILSYFYQQQITFLDVSFCQLDKISFNIICNDFSNLKGLLIQHIGPAIINSSLSLITKNVKFLALAFEEPSYVNRALKALSRSESNDIVVLSLLIPDSHRINWDLITKKLNNLRSLRIRIRSRFPSRLTGFCRFRLLDILTICEETLSKTFSVLSDLNLNPIFRQCINLREVNLISVNQNTSTFSQTTFVILNRHCTKLEILRLTKCDINDSVLKVIAKSLYIKRLELNHLENITDEGISNLITHNKIIKFMTIKSCANISNHIITSWYALAKKQPEISFEVHLGGANYMCLNGKPENLKLKITTI